MLAAGYKEDELLETEKPLLLSYIYDWFMDLQSARKSNGFALMPIEFSEIKSYFELINQHPQKWELDTIRRLDSVALSLHRK